MIPIAEIVSNVIRAVANYFGWAEKRQDLKNSPEMQKRVQAQNEANGRERVNKEIAEGDVEALRKELSE
jgi:hypothetical protein